MLDLILNMSKILYFLDFKNSYTKPYQYKYYVSFIIGLTINETLVDV